MLKIGEVFDTLSNSAILKRSTGIIYGSAGSWVPVQPRKGDHIRVNRGLYYHHGIYVSKYEVIHFNTEGKGDCLTKDSRIIKTDLYTFLKNETVEVNLIPKNFSRKKVIRRARLRIGDAGYNIVLNNCEHFAEWCTTGKSCSAQVETIVIKLTKAVYFLYKKYREKKQRNKYETL